VRFIIDIVGFQATWWAAALGAGAGSWIPGSAIGGIVVLLQVLAAKVRLATIATVLIALLLGFAAETAMIASGLVRYSATWPLPGLPPLWLLMLWMVFATCIEATLRMLGNHALIKGALLGAVVAPPTYWAGESFAALSFAEPKWMGLAATAVAWAIATPIMLAVYRRLTCA
jgi:hypothetical protein